MIKIFLRSLEVKNKLILGEIYDKVSNQMTSKVISKEELFSNKKALEIDTSDLDYPQDFLVTLIFT